MATSSTAAAATALSTSTTASTATASSTSTEVLAGSLVKARVVELNEFLLLALTLTLPVVVTADEDAAAGAEKRAERPVELELGLGLGLGMERSTGAAVGEARLVEFEEEGAGVERALLAEAEEEVEEEMHELVFHKWLMAAQCCLGPLFCVAVLFGASRPFIPFILVS